MTKIRVLVVEDSRTVREHLLAVMGADPQLEVVGAAEDGRRAIELCQSLRPDVVTLDMALPVMSGLAATEYIMAFCPTPIVIVSASTNRGELFKTYEALAAGALDVLEKPLGNERPGDWEQRLTSTVKLVSRIRVVTHPRARLRRMGETASDQRPPTPDPRPPTTESDVSRPSVVGGRWSLVAGRSSSPCRLIAIGASTGGPGALIEILQALPAGFPLPILLVVHIGQPFAVAFAEWLDGHSVLPVRYANDGEPLPLPGEGRILVAPPGCHLAVQQGRLRLTEDAERHSCRPSIDVLFESLARECGAEAAACLLTGMGRDGAQGLLAIRHAGGRTLAQDEATSVVFGMPREAILLGAAERVLPLEQFAPALAALAGSAEARKRS
jgi:two-component system chemotaxis response regulator CheB